MADGAECGGGVRLMAEYLIKDTTLTAIGNAIRTKDGSTGLIAVPDIAQRILDIKSSGAILTITAPAGATVTVANGDESYTKTTDSSGIAVFSGLKTGEWLVTISDGTQSNSKKIYVAYEYAESIGFDVIPVFTYTGDYEIVDDSDTPITATTAITGNWKIRFLTSGTLKFSRLKGAEGGIDVFLVGGGGGGAPVAGGGVDGSYQYGSGGGGGGYTRTVSHINIDTSQEYSITIGAGGAVNSYGGQTSAFGSSVNGGSKGTNRNGGNGGSGGSAGSYAQVVGAVGGEDGSNGSRNGGGTTPGSGGTGQGTTTREFGVSTAKRYGAGGAGGGGANFYSNGAGQGAVNSSGGGGAGVPDGPANSGSGGAGGCYLSSNGEAGAGGSGIVIIRNHRT